MNSGDDFTDGVNAAAALLDKMADDYARDHSTQDSETGVWEFGRHGEDYYNTLRELADDIRGIVHGNTQRRAGLASQDTAQAELTGVEAVDAADNRWFGDMMILQVLADSDNVNDQEREVLTRWMEASFPPSRLAAIAAVSAQQAGDAAGVLGAPNDQGQVREDSQGLGEPGRLSPSAGVSDKEGANP